MLQDIRDNAQGTIAKVIVALIAVTFAVVGVESIVGGMGGEPEVAVVNGDSVTESQFAKAVDQRRRQILNQMGANADPSMIDEALLRRTVLEGLIEEQVLLHAAEEKGLVISAALIDQYIRSLPVFQQDGQFSQEAYASTLRSAGMLPLEFRQAITRELLLQQGRESVRQTAFVTDDEMKQLIRLDRQTRDLSFLKIPAERFTAEVTVSEGEIKKYYEANREQFKLPERVQVEYVELDKSSLASQVTVSDEELKKRYEQEAAQAQGQEERSAAHILVEVNDEQTEEQALAKVQEIQKELAAGGDFAELAKKYSQDPGSAGAGGDLGYVTKGIFVPEFDAELFSMNEGQISEPVKTDFGYHIIKLNEVRQRETPSFEEMKDQLAATIKEEKAEQLYAEKGEKLADVSYSASDLAEPAQAVGLEVKESPVFARTGGEGLFANPRVINAAFSEDVLEGNNSDPVELGKDKTVVLRLKEHFGPEVQPLAVVEADIRTLLVKEKALEKAAEFGKQLIADYRQSSSLDQIAEKAGQAWESQTDVRRGQPEMEPEILKHAFAMPAPEPASEGVEAKARLEGFKIGDDGFALIAITEVKDGELASYSESELKTIKDIITQSVGGREYSLQTELLQEKAEIERI